MAGQFTGAATRGNDSEFTPVQLRPLHQPTFSTAEHGRSHTAKSGVRAHSIVCSLRTKSKGAVPKGKNCRHVVGTPAQAIAAVSEDDPQYKDLPLPDKLRLLPRYLTVVGVATEELDVQTPSAAVRRGTVSVINQLRKRETAVAPSLLPGRDVYLCQSNVEDLDSGFSITTDPPTAGDIAFSRALQSMYSGGDESMGIKARTAALFLQQAIREATLICDSMDPKTISVLQIAHIVAKCAKFPVRAVRVQREHRMPWRTARKMAAGTPGRRSAANIAAGRAIAPHPTDVPIGMGELVSVVDGASSVSGAGALPTGSLLQVDLPGAGVRTGIPLYAASSASLVWLASIAADTAYCANPFSNPPAGPVACMFIRATAEKGVQISAAHDKWHDASQTESYKLAYSEQSGPAVFQARSSIIVDLLLSMCTVARKIADVASPVALVTAASNPVVRRLISMCAAMTSGQETHEHVWDATIANAMKARMEAVVVEFSKDVAAADEVRTLANEMLGIPMHDMRFLTERGWTWESARARYMPTMPLDGPADAIQKAYTSPENSARVMEGIGKLAARLHEAFDGTSAAAVFNYDRQEIEYAVFGRASEELTQCAVVSRVGTLSNITGHGPVLLVSVA